jgi:hypothetical protein
MISSMGFVFAAGLGGGASSAAASGGGMNVTSRTLAAKAKVNRCSDIE